MVKCSKKFVWVAVAFLLGSFGFDGPAASADLGGGPEPLPVEPMAQTSPWAFSFTTYGWLTWMSGDLTVKGRSVSVDVAPNQVLDALDWSGIPAWFSYAEARNGRLTLFNDIVYAQLSGAAGFSRQVGGAALGLNVKADYEQAIVELGGAYEIWSGNSPGLGASAIDVLAGGRYWHQDTSISADLATTIDIAGLTVSGGRAYAKSGSVDWVDPFIGARLRQDLAPGQRLTLRGDIGGFDAGSKFTWQIIGTYDFQLCATDRYTLDGYVGYRALSVDYSQGSGANRYDFDVLMQGPVMGATLRF